MKPLKRFVHRDVPHNQRYSLCRILILLIRVEAIDPLLQTKSFYLFKNTIFSDIDFINFAFHENRCQRSFFNQG
jgi:hypothetical protein